MLPDGSEERANPRGPSDRVAADPGEQDEPWISAASGTITKRTSVGSLSLPFTGSWSCR
jgi:hypothetical protein